MAILVRIEPKSLRAKTRVREHGEYMQLLKFEWNRFLVISQGKTWRGETWMGWFTLDEADYEEVDQQEEDEA